MNNIKAFRNKRLLTVKSLSEISGIAVGYISGLENGRVNNPSLVTMRKISIALESTVPEVFFPDERGGVVNASQRN